MGSIVDIIEVVNKHLTCSTWQVIYDDGVSFKIDIDPDSNLGIAWASFQETEVSHVMTYALGVVHATHHLQAPVKIVQFADEDLQKCERYLREELIRDRLFAYDAAYRGTNSEHMR